MSTVGGGTSGGTSGGGTAAGGAGSDEPCDGGVRCNGACLMVGQTEGNCTALAQIDAFDLAMDADYIYYTASNGIGRVAKSDGAVSVIDEQAAAVAIAVNSTLLFYSTPGASDDAKLFAMPKAGGAAVELDTHDELIRPIRAGEARVFYFEEHFGGPSDVSSVSVTGTDPLLHGTSDTSFGSLAVDDLNVYWGDSPFVEDAFLWRSPQESAMPEAIGAANTVFYPVVVGDYVYFHESVADALFRVPRAGGEQERLGTTPDIRVSNAAFYGNSSALFYITSQGISRVGLDGMNSEPLITASVRNVGAADATHFYIIADKYLVKAAL
jgi:hypothetical protein